MRRVLALALIASGAARAAPVEAQEPRPIVGFRVRGDSKVTERTLRYLAHHALGDRVGPGDIPRITADLLSSELFESVAVALEDAPGGVIVVATLDDKLSWIVAPTVFVLPGKKAFGVGYAENNLRGWNKKILVYGQYGAEESLFFGTFFDPSVRGTKLRLRGDVYMYSRLASEYGNPIDDPTNAEIARETTTHFVGAGVLGGWAHRWWWITDLRLRAGRVWYTDPQTVDDDPTPLPPPQADSWDVTAQLFHTIDRRGHRYGVTWGPYLQLVLEASLPGLATYGGYRNALLRGYYSWRLFGEHQLELRSHWNVSRDTPFHQELSLGGVSDLRGYAVDRFRGDTRIVGRAEYSVPIVRWKFFSFRAIGFYDTGYIGWHLKRNRERDYLDNQRDGAHWFRNNVGGGVRVYVKSVVLPLLGLDLAYGIEGEAPEVYFEVGLTDF